VEASALMVAYSFKRCFVAPIQVGLGQIDGTKHQPKRQTIRARRGRHAWPGEEVQLYHGMRTKHCFLIGRARCVDVQGISIHFRKRRRSDWLRCAQHGKLDRPHSLDLFARLDGFHDWQDLRTFWRAEHPGIDDFEGVLILWEPLNPGDRPSP
jgi:hypothetical protein